MVTRAVRDEEESHYMSPASAQAPIATSPHAAECGNTLEVSVIMPCLNERATVGTCVKKAQDTIRLLGIQGEVVIGDNGSTDGSQQIANDLGARVIAIEKRGYGAALLGAIAAARGKYIVMGDSDDSYDFTQLGSFVSKLREGYDLVMGNRFKGGIRPGAMPLLHRYLGNPVLTSIGQLFFKSPISDFHCGLRAFRKDSIEMLQLQTEGMEFASEMVVKATLFGLRLGEVPTTLSPDGRDRAPHLRTWRDGWRHLRFLLMYSPKWLFLYPGAFLFLLGTAATLWLLPHSRTVGGITLGVDTLLFASMSVLLGFQSINFATFTKIFAITEGLRPEDQRLNKLFRYVKLETGLTVGAILVVLGAGFWIVGLSYWARVHFGPLDPLKTLRIVIPGIVCLTLGFQVILSSFFLSILGMARRWRR
jgi:glycosyltransferase involved in cell wall biosynthesis